MTDYDLKLKCFSLALQAHIHTPAFGDTLADAKLLYDWAKTPITYAQPPIPARVSWEDPHE